MAAMRSGTADGCVRAGGAASLAGVRVGVTVGVGFGVGFALDTGGVVSVTTGAAAAVVDVPNNPPLGAPALDPVLTLC